MIIARKIFSPNFRGGGARAPSPAPVSYAYVQSVSIKQFLECFILLINWDDGERTCWSDVGAEKNQAGCLERSVNSARASQFYSFGNFVGSSWLLRRKYDYGRQAAMQFHGCALGDL